MRANEFLIEQEDAGFYAVGDTVAYNIGMSNSAWKTLAKPGANAFSPSHRTAISLIPRGSTVAISVGADDVGTPSSPEAIASAAKSLVEFATGKGLNVAFVLFPSIVGQEPERADAIRQAITSSINVPTLDMNGPSGTARYGVIAQQIMSKFSPTAAAAPSVAPTISADPDIYNKLSPYVAPDKRGSGLKGLQPAFAQALYNMIKSAPPDIGKQIQIFSGFRTEERQKELWAGALRKYGSVAAARRWVAPPTGIAGSQGSRHNWGVAADLKFGSGAAQKWVHANCNKFGLGFRMGHEKWHIEPTDPTIIASAKSNWLSKFA